MNAQVGRPDSSEYAPFYAGYVSLVPEEGILEALESQSREVEELFKDVSDPDHRYEPEKWSVKQILGHIIDGERVFAFRAISFARGDQSELPPFDEGEYVKHGGYDDVPPADLIEIFRNLRRANALLFRHLPPDAWRRTGVANRSSVTVRALAYIMVGHVRHHMRVVRERYSVALRPTSSR